MRRNGGRCLKNVMMNFTRIRFQSYRTPNVKIARSCIRSATNCSRPHWIGWLLAGKTDTLFHMESRIFFLHKNHELMKMIVFFCCCCYFSSVIGIYTTFVFVASRFFRGLFSGGSSNIIYSELPYVDRILQLCLDIYLVRESLEFALEEDLFAKLIFLYRSPETMIRWTRTKEEQSADEDDTSDIDETEAEKVLRKTPMRPLIKS